MKAFARQAWLWAAVAGLVATFTGCHKPTIVEQSPFDYTISSNTILILGYTGTAKAVTIPSKINGLAVKRVGCQTFSSTEVTSVGISCGVTEIESTAFVDSGCLTEVIIPETVENIGGGAFADCPNLTGVFFKGNAPWLGERVFERDDKATVYHLPNATGWSNTFGGRPTAIWNQQTNAPTAAGGAR